jgi:hypothetical protein
MNYPVFSHIFKIFFGDMGHQKVCMFIQIHRYTVLKPIRHESVAFTRLYKTVLYMYIMSSINNSNSLSLQHGSLMKIEQDT